MSGALKVIPFTADYLEFVQDFDCGDDPWETEVAAWIRAEPGDDDGALGEMRKYNEKDPTGLQVWLYLNESGDVVGFGSLGRSRWKWPEPDSKRVPISLIPNVAVQRQFQGGGDAGPKYALQILRHLAGEARKIAGPEPLLGLFVHPNNTKARRFYEKKANFHYTKEHIAWKNPKTGVEYPAMIARVEVVELATAGLAATAPGAESAGESPI